MVHNGLWSPLLSGSAGTGMAWDWNWLDDDSFYRYIQAATQVVKGIPFSRRTWRDVQVQAFEFADALRKPYYADALIEGFPGNYAFPREALDRELFTVREDGRLDRQDLLHARLGERQSWRTPSKSFQVRYPVDGQFIVYVPELGGGPKPAPRLTVSLDGNVALEQELLPYGPADQYDPRAYYQKYAIAVPAGAHMIRVANTGGGTITTAFELTNYVRRNGPHLEVRGMQTDDYILLWLKHPEFNWMYRRMGMTSDEQPAGSQYPLEVQRSPPGHRLGNAAESDRLREHFQHEQLLDLAGLDTLHRSAVSYVRQHQSPGGLRPVCMRWQNQCAPTPPQRTRLVKPIVLLGVAERVESLCPTSIVQQQNLVAAGDEEEIFRQRVGVTELVSRVQPAGAVRSVWTALLVHDRDVSGVFLLPVPR